MIKVNSPYIGDEEINAVSNVLRSGIIAYGDVVREFESEFAKYLGVKHVVTLSNGTVALYVALKCLGIGEGDEVIVPDFTFFATASMVVAAGAKPVFADIDPVTYTLDVNDVKNKITNKTKAIIAVHLFGHPAKMDELKEIADSYGIDLIEDCAQAHGAEYKGKKVGSIGRIAAFSFYATKNLTTGEGGAIATNDDELAYTAQLLRNHGQDRKYHHVIIGWNFRLTNIQAAIGLVQLQKLDSMNKRRHEIAKKYRKGLSKLDELRLPVEMEWAKHVYHQYTVWIKEESLRDSLMTFLGERGIQTAIHYPEPLHIQPAFQEYVSSSCCKNAEEASKHVLSLPMHPSLTDEDVNKVISSIVEFFSRP